MEKVNDIMEYIDAHLTLPGNLTMALHNFQILDSLLNDPKYISNIDYIMELINNQKIKTSLDIIFKKYDRVIISDKASTVFTNTTLLAFIDAYCILNDIDVIASEDIAMPPLINSYIQETSCFPLLSKEEEYELFSKMANGDKKAKNKIICSNLRLVISYAKKYFNSYEPMELIQEGNIGLIKAVEKFDVTKGYKFSTYATYWINQRITNYLEKYQNQLSLSVSIKQKLQKLRKLKNAFILEHFREPTFQELLQITQLSETKLIELMQYEQIKIINADEKILPDKDETVISFIPSQDNVEETIINNDLSHKILELFDKAKLSDREKSILLYRFGFIDDRIYTQEELASIFKIKHQRIGQIERRALIKLRNCAYTSNFSIYVDHANQKNHK